jgi:phosphatidylglycerophosphate synthase
MTEPTPTDSRRPLATRSAGWAKALAAALARARVSPNLISFISIPIAVAGAAALLYLPAPAGPLLCAVAVQLRLLCNLLDGMVAVEGALGSPTGPLWNELPDRIADTVFIVALGMAAGYPELGWLGAVLAAITAYLRTTGGALGFAQDFTGVQSKPKRMFVMTVGCLFAAFLPREVDGWSALFLASAIIAAGSFFTCVTRTRRLARQLRERAAASGTPS